MDSLTSVSGLSEVASFIGNFLALLVVAGVIFLFALRQGRASLISLVMALYAAVALFTIFPYGELLNGDSALGSFVANALIFAVFTFLAFSLMRRVATSGGMAIRGIVLAGLSVFTAGFVLAVGYHLLGLSAAVPLTPSLQVLFGPDKYFFWWCVAPLVGIFLAAR